MKKVVIELTKREAEKLEDGLRSYIWQNYQEVDPIIRKVIKQIEKQLNREG
jgi:hypothetical protein